ncbi:hypothetical protein TOPH_08598 [Tolypocladium ophioglossoides CBS 100239]|uniref:Peptidase S9 prolyl oligopeptidase catalytic domain-containing protein n=1 Tax=Tolypocladium ophioglossoides (strain CBS 100239) TaxID=1163406 RepID=A0A0L0MY84_TOLOC|nr:hypothetical protein TOPH_08598 [Tolypocladium ophioglossoides CBS 100239]
MWRKAQTCSLKTDIPLLLKRQNQMASVSGGHSSAPVLVMQGLNDISVLPDVTRAVWQCSRDDKSKVHLSAHPALDHSPVVVAPAPPEWLTWMDSRFAGHRTSGSCSRAQ